MQSSSPVPFQVQKRKQTDGYCAYRLTCIVTLLLSAMIYGGCLLLFFTCFMNIYIQIAVLVLFLAYSLVNPIIYAVRMPGFREGLLQLVYGVPDLSRIAPANLPLRNLQRPQINGSKTIDEVCPLNNFNFSAEQHTFPFYFQWYES